MFYVYDSILCFLYKYFPSKNKNIFPPTGRLVPVQPAPLVEYFSSETSEYNFEASGDNSVLFDDNTSQKLSTQTILKLKKV